MFVVAVVSPPRRRRVSCFGNEPTSKQLQRMAVRLVSFLFVWSVIGFVLRD